VAVWLCSGSPPVDQAVELLQHEQRGAVAREHYIALDTRMELSGSAQRECPPQHGPVWQTSPVLSLSQGGGEGGVAVGGVMGE